MSYIGTQQGTAAPVLLDAITVVNGQAAYTMQKSGVNYSPASTLVMQVSLNGIIQQPGGGSYTMDGSTITFASALVTGDVIDYILVREPTTGTIAPIDASVTNSKIVSMAASKLTGALPAIDGSALTNLPGGGKLLKHAVNIISTQTSRNSTSIGQICDFGSFTPSSTNSKIVVQGHAYFGIASAKYWGVRWVVDGVNYISTGTYSSAKTFSNYQHNGYSNYVVPVLTEITNTDGSAITVTMDSSSAATLYLNRSSVADNGSTAGAAGISAVAFYEIDNS